MVAATFEEERVPALPARSSSRELGVVEGGVAEQPGNRSTVAITFPVWLLVVVALASGAAVAYKGGAFAGSSVAAVEPSHKGPQPSTPEAQGKSPAGGHQEFLKHTVAQAVVADERRTLPAASAQARGPSSRAAEVKNETGEHNGTLDTRGAHNASLETSANSTSDARVNSTHANKTRQHKHLKCKGGSLAACQCLFACKVFGGQPSQCSGEKVALVDALIGEALTTPSTACRGMQCIVRCAKSLQCFDAAIRSDCRALRNSSASDLQEDVEDTSCRYECDEDEAEEIVVRK